MTQYSSLMLRLAATALVMLFMLCLEEVNTDVWHPHQVCFLFMLPFCWCHWGTVGVGVAWLVTLITKQQQYSIFPPNGRAFEARL